MRLALVTVLMMGGVAVAEPQQAVMDCWPERYAAKNVEVEVEFEIDSEGSLIGMPTSPQAESSDVNVASVAEAAIRAVRRCAPYRAPAGRHQVLFPEPVPDRT